MEQYSTEDSVVKTDGIFNTETSSDHLLQEDISYEKDTEAVRDEVYAQKPSMPGTSWYNLQNRPAVTTRYSWLSTCAIILIPLILVMSLLASYLGQRPASTDLNQSPNTPADDLSQQTSALQPTTNRDRTAECGWSPTEAIKRGCTFDHLSMLWLPQDASRIGNHEFMNRGGPNGWQYWADRAGQQPIPDISMHEDQLFTTTREHLAHCAYHFLRVTEALRDKSLFAWKVYRQDHNKHCIMFLLQFAMTSNASDIDSITSSNYIGYGTAVPPGHPG